MLKGLTSSEEVEMAGINGEQLRVASTSANTVERSSRIRRQEPTVFFRRVFMAFSVAAS